MSRARIWGKKMLSKETASAKALGSVCPAKIEALFLNSSFYSKYVFGCVGFESQHLDSPVVACKPQ